CATSDQDTEAINRGKTTVDNAFQTPANPRADFGYPLIVKPGRGAYTSAYTTGGAATPAANPRMAAAFAVLSKATTAMKSVQEINAAVSMSTFCQDRRNLADISRLQPQAVRQAVLDQNNDRSREALTRMMCKKGIMSQFQTNDQTLDCTAPGVTGDPAGSGGMTINRVNYGFPYVNDSNYTLKTLDGGRTEISTKINYRFQYDPSIDPGSASYLGNDSVPVANRKGSGQQQTEFNTNTAAWAQASTNFFNDAANRIKDPKVTFKIEKKCPTTCADTDETPPLVVVSECYRAGGRPDTFTADFPGQAWDPHKCYYKSQVPPDSPPGTAPVPTRMYGDWRDAGGFTTTMAPQTVQHETGHNLGLADEYIEDYYPAHPVGENGATGCNNSTMGSNHSTMGSDGAFCNVLYRRHLLEMIRPARACPRP
ncbi:MAG: hypothetical protein AABY86_00770, partial [Bdellovibrionota bacterium]